MTANKFNINQSIALANFLTNLATAWFVAGILTPILTKAPISGQVIFNIFLSVVFTLIFLVSSLYVVRTEERKK